MAFAKVYRAKVPVTAADLLNDQVLPFFEDQGVPVLRVLTDRGKEYCGAADRHPYELFLQYNDIEHTKTRARRPQSNGICESFHKTILNEFYKVAFRKKIYTNLEELQKDLDGWLDVYKIIARTRVNAVKDGRLWKLSLMVRSWQDRRI